VTGAADGPCHTAGPGDTASRLPWTDDPRGTEKTELLKYALQNPEGVRPTVAARKVLNPEAVAGDADDRLARRFYENHGKLFKTARRDRVGGTPTGGLSLDSE